MTSKIGTTIYDVAAKAEVSIATVSRFLNDPDRVKGVTGKKIQDAIEELRYIPHGNAGSKKSRQMGRVGVLTPFFPAPSFVQRLQGMIPVLRESNMEMLVYTVDSSDQLREYLHSIPFTKRLDGLILMSMRIPDKDAFRLLHSGLEVVIIEHGSALFSSVETDNYKGGSLAARHFLEKGYWPLAFLGESSKLPYSLQPSPMRFTGFQETLAKEGRVIDPAYLRLGEFHFENARKLALELLDQKVPPRAVFAMSDLQAFGVIKAARERGLRVPQDLAVLGYDDIEASEWMELSTVSQHLAESGRLAAEILMARIRDPKSPLQNVRLDLTLVQRQST